MQPRVLSKNEDVKTGATQQLDEATQRPNGRPSLPPRLEDSPEDQDDDDVWESQTIYEELLDGESETYDHIPRQDVCTTEEKQRYRQRLREIGLQAFIAETLGKPTISVEKLMTAFGVKLHEWLLDAPEAVRFRALGLALMRELNKRQRLEQYSTLEDAADLINKSKNIMIVTGAGISTSLGIPDFRSKTTGFYTKLQEQGYDEPEEVFDLHTFDENPKVFYSLAADILPVLDKWTPTHQFIRAVQDKDKLLRNYTQNIDNIESHAGIRSHDIGSISHSFVLILYSSNELDKDKLLRNYTQNIDNIESHAGIRSEKLIQCHGSFASATCRRCNFKVPGEQIFDSIKARKVATCKRCETTLRTTAKPSLKRKRTPNGVQKSRHRYPDEDDDSDGQYDIPEPGVLKPDITFFGEKLPDTFFDTLRHHDREKVDLVIVMGTSMKVAPVSEIPQFVPQKVPQIYISRDPIHHIDFDINLLGDCDTVVAALCQRAGWDLQHEMLRPQRKIVVRAHASFEHTYTVSAVVADSQADVPTSDISLLP